MAYLSKSHLYIDRCLQAENLEIPRIYEMHHVTKETERGKLLPH